LSDYMSIYKAAVIAGQGLLADDPKVVFVGQHAVATDFYGTLSTIPLSKRIEMPVAEEMQVGICIGMALAGLRPVCIIQRMDFLPRCADQLVNHLDKIKVASKGKFDPVVMIRTTIGSKYPIDPGIQHTQNLCAMFAGVLKETDIYLLENAGQVLDCYQKVRQWERSSLIVEYADLYKEGGG
jgi:pyruvate/2-oxoglutarate/acetoin dehydrogenase E1 component